MSSFLFCAADRGPAIERICVLNSGDEMIEHGRRGFKQMLWSKVKYDLPSSPAYQWINPTYVKLQPQSSFASCLNDWQFYAEKLPPNHPNCRPRVRLESMLSSNIIVDILRLVEPRLENSRPCFLLHWLFPLHDQLVSGNFWAFKYTWRAVEDFFTSNVYKN